MDFEKWVKELNQINRWVYIRVILIIANIAFLFLYMLFSKRSHSLLIFLVFALFLNIINRIDKKKMKQAFLNVDAILLKECDAMNYLLVVSECYNAFLQGQMNRYSFMMHDLEQRYCMALLVNGNVEEAMSFLESPVIVDHKSQHYRRMMFQTLFMKAYILNDRSRYPMNLQYESYVFRKYPLFRARKYVLFQEYEKAITFLNKYKTHSSYEEVMKQYLLGVCYNRTQRDEQAKKCEDFVYEHGQNLYFCYLNKQKEIIHHDFEEDKHTFSFMCDDQYVKNCMRYEHVVLTSMGYIGCFLIAWLLFIFLLLFNYKTLKLADFLMNGFPYLFLVMIIALIFSIVLIYVYKKKKYHGIYQVCLYNNHAKIENEYGKVEPIDDVRVRKNRYILVTRSNRSYTLFTNQLNDEDICAVNRFVKDKPSMRIHYILQRILWLIGIFIFVCMANYSYQNHIESMDQKEDAMDQKEIVYESIDYKVSEDGQYGVRLEASEAEKNKSLLRIQLYQDGYQVDKEEVLVSKEYNTITKDDWQVSFKEDAIYVDVCNQESVKLPYADKVRDEDDHTLKIEQGYKALYQQYFQKQNYSYIMDFNAKGQSSILLFEDENKVVHISYDHDSANGKCGIYVLLENKKDAEGNSYTASAKILNFYAYEYTSGKCVLGDKHDYSQPGSEEYVELTGEV